MAKQLSELRDDGAKLKTELRRLAAQLREGEVALLLARSRGERLMAEAPSLRRLLRESSQREVPAASDVHL